MDQCPDGGTHVLLLCRCRLQSHTKSCPVLIRLLQYLKLPSSATSMTSTPASLASFTMFAVPLPPGNATTRSGLPSSNICLFLIGPAALPWVSQSAGYSSEGHQFITAQSSATVSTPRA